MTNLNTIWKYVLAYQASSVGSSSHRNCRRGFRQMSDFHCILILMDDTRFKLNATSFPRKKLKISFCTSLEFKRLNPWISCKGKVNITKYYQRVPLFNQMIPPKISKSSLPLQSTLYMIWIYTVDVWAKGLSS